MNGSARWSGGWRWTGALVALAVCMAWSNAPVVALDQGCVEDDTTVRVSKTLVSRAEALAEQGTSWKLAAQLMLEAAALRPECSPERLTGLQSAARFFRFAGEFDRASDAAYQAGEHCVWNGHVTAAADAFIDAATYALEVGDESRVRTAAGHASRLASSPLLSQLQRITIQGRAERLLERDPHGEDGRPRPGGRVI